MTVFAYILIVKGLFWVTMPYLMRDHIAMERAEHRALDGAARPRACFTAQRSWSALLRAIERGPARGGVKRILVIRGGAIGDFVLTLPAIGLLRRAYPQARLEILGYKHIVALAEHRFYAEAVRSIEARRARHASSRSDAELPAELIGYFSSFDLVVSYLFDPDGIFRAERRALRGRKFPGLLAENSRTRTCRPTTGATAGGTRSGAGRLRRANLIRPNRIATEARASFPISPTIALHPGSGSAKQKLAVGKLDRADRAPPIDARGGVADCRR